MDRTAQAERGIVSVRMLGGGLAVLRIMFGAVWLSNGLTKVFLNEDSNVDLGFVLGNWGFFAWFLTVAEIVTGLLLVFGVAARLGATIGLLLIGPVWIMLLDTNLYLWEYPIELLPLLVLAIVPAGRTFGRDRVLAPRFGGRWPF